MDKSMRESLICAQLTYIKVREPRGIEALVRSVLEAEHRQIIPSLMDLTT